ncbi:MAB_1171c family putative transporter [Streptomyces sp. WMMC897]|uniref:MAB_1171c family putative transporter n=1 Tax=Streptomyces sp. WMMC897 TaxID=3014782 RepID=UPI0022B606EA|nr:MAB_1171c family putative transporter [Streptomyces sp. WMMC897]MCZ7416140.1 hypothetical protein [Streptomyces sp. WMMC897]
MGPGEALPYLPALLAVGVSGYELRQIRRGRTGPAARLLCCFGFAMGAAVVILAPPTGETLARLADPFPSLTAPAHLLGRELKMVALYFLVLTVFKLRLSGPTVTREERWTGRGHGRFTVTALVVCAVCFLAARPRAADGHVYAHGSGRYAVAAANTVFTLYSLWCVCVFVLVVVQHARGLSSGPLRTGLRLLVASGVVGLLWAVWGVTAIVDMLGTGSQPVGHSTVSVLLSGCCLLLAGLGATAARWGPLTERPARWLRAYRDHRALRPLWSALWTVLPESAVLVPRRRGVEFARYRRVIEIRDGYLALRPYVHPDTAEWTAEALRRHPVPEERRAAATEAAALAVALACAGTGRRRHRTAERVGDTTAPAIPARRDRVDAEAAWLADVAWEFVHSPAVAHARARAGRQLAEPG